MSHVAPIDRDLFRSTMGRWASGVTVITTVHEGQPYGMTASSFSSLSLDPPLVLVCVDHRAHLHQHLPQARRYGVSVLASDQEALSTHFAGRPQVDLSILWVHAEGIPLLGGALAHLVCDVDAILPGGDHTIYVGRVTHAAVWPDRDPLLYFGGKYRSLAPVPVVS